MTQMMKGVRVLEVAQFTFVPAAGAILAMVIKAGDRTVTCGGSPMSA